MRGKQLLILATVALALTITAVLTSRDTHITPPSRIGNVLFKDMDVNLITSLMITTKDASLKLEKIDDIWVCPEKQNYPVKYDRIKNLVLKIAEMKIGQIPNVNDELRAKMGMIAPVNGGTGTLIDLRSKEGKSIASLLVGKSRQTATDTGYRGYPEGTYVSDDLGERVYLVKDSFHHATTEPRGWLTTELLAVPPSSIERISFTDDDGSLLTLNKVDDKMILEGLKKKEVTNESTAQSLLSAIQSLHMDDVANPSLSESELGMDRPIIYEAETSEGVIYSIHIGRSVKRAEERYLRISARLKTVEAEDESTSVDPELESRIIKLNNKLSKWTYTVATYKTDTLVCTRENIVTAKKKSK